MQPAAERFWTTLDQHAGIALSEGPRQLSYAELRHEVAARASHLQQLGVQRVDLALQGDQGVRLDVGFGPVGHRRALPLGRIEIVMKIFKSDVVVESL